MTLYALGDTVGVRVRALLGRLRVHFGGLEATQRGRHEGDGQGNGRQRGAVRLLPSLLSTAPRNGLAHLNAAIVRRGHVIHAVQINVRARSLPMLATSGLGLADACGVGAAFGGAGVIAGVAADTRELALQQHLR